MLSHWIALLLFILVGLHQSASAAKCPVQNPYLKFQAGVNPSYTCEWDFNATVASNQKLVICHRCIASINCTDDVCKVEPSSDPGCEAGVNSRICGVFSKLATSCRVDLPKHTVGLCYHNQIPERMTMRVEAAYGNDMFKQLLDCQEGPDTTLPVCNGTVPQSATTPQPVVDEATTESPRHSTTASSEDGEVSTVSTIATMPYPDNNSTRTQETTPQSGSVYGGPTEGQEATTHLITSEKASFPAYAIVIIIVIVILIVLAVVIYLRRRRNAPSSAPIGSHHAEAAI